MRRLYGFVCSIAALAALSACATPYMAADIRSTVVDAETNQPIEGVIVVAKWELFEGGPGHGGRSGNMLNLAEVVTDREGKFVVPGWGPKVAPPLTYLQDGQPELLMFKSGYEPLKKISQFTSGVGPATYTMRSSLDGQVIKMKKEARPLADYAWSLSSFQTSLQWNRESSNWKHFPRMITAIDREARRVIEQVEDAKLPRRIPMPETIDSLASGRKEVEEYFKGAAK